MADIVHITHRVGWQDLVRRSLHAFKSHGFDAVPVEFARADQKSIEAAIEGGASVVCNHAFVHNANEFVQMAAKYPHVQFVALDHCSLNHRYRWPKYFDSGLTYIRAAATLPNCWFGGPDKYGFPLYSELYNAERVIWWPNPVMMPEAPSSIRPDPSLIMIACRDDFMKGIPSQMAAMALVKRQRPETRLAVSLCFGEKTIPSLKALAQTLNTEFEWWRYGSSDDWYDRLNRYVSIAMQVSTHESFGYVAIDAMGYGRPVVCGECIDFAPESWKVGTERPAAIAEKVSYHLDHYEESAAIARQTVESVAASQNAAYVATFRRIMENNK